MTKMIFEKMSIAIIDGDEDAARNLALEALSQGIEPLEAIEKGFSLGMKVVGEKFENSELWLPDIIASADAMEAAMEILKKEIEIKQKGASSQGTVVLGTNKGDVHDIGKNIVKTMLSANGFTVYDLGKDVPVEAFIEKAKEVKADIIAMSALMTSTMLYMPELIIELKELGLRNDFKVIVGGAPVIADWAKKIGADGYGVTASEAVRVCKKLISGGRVSD